jgi:phage-related protein
MPRTELVFYKDDDGTVPVREWLQALQRQNRRAFAKCIARIRRLAELGHELRRPEADFLRDEIYELRAKMGHVQYRILYFFQGREIAILAHALTKKDKVPSADIDRAVRRKAAFRRDPAAHSLEVEIDSGQDDGRTQNH